jgi:hypothetical protein
MTELNLTGDDFLQHRDASFSEGQEVVYIISCAESENSNLKRSIGRVLTVDEAGTLYIGKASNVGRLVTLLLSVRDGNNGKNHSFGIRYKANPLFRDQFPLELLRIQLLSTPDSRHLETTKLSEYVACFGELPPLNHCE